MPDKVDKNKKHDIPSKFEYSVTFAGENLPNSRIGEITEQVCVCKLKICVKFQNGTASAHFLLKYNFWSNWVKIPKIGTVWRNWRSRNIPGITLKEY